MPGTVHQRYIGMQVCWNCFNTQVTPRHTCRDMLCMYWWRGRSIEMSIKWTNRNVTHTINNKKTQQQHTASTIESIVYGRVSQSGWASESGNRSNDHHYAGLLWVSKVIVWMGFNIMNTNIQASMLCRAINQPKYIVYTFESFVAFVLRVYYTQYISYTCSSQTHIVRYSTTIVLLLLLLVMLLLLLLFLLLLFFSWNERILFILCSLRISFDRIVTLVCVMHHTAPMDICSLRFELNRLNSTILWFALRCSAQFDCLFVCMCPVHCVAFQTGLMDVCIHQRYI